MDAARASGVPTAFAGVDLNLSMPDGGLQRPAAVHDYLARFDFVGVRSAAAVSSLASTGSAVHHGAAWALRLPTDQGDDLSSAPRRVAVVLRELPLERISWDFIAALESLLEGLRKRGFEPFWLPFCPEDERFLGELALALFDGGLPPVSNAALLAAAEGRLAEMIKRLKSLFAG